ncbi:MAG TPA: hypothetical protein VGQ76_06835 [Thermoanaerobaculia bacterium]|jgi:uncharacterized membrane protein|nr:hypothetical protein [Thermoanaerobaculia bacterium]
MPEHDSRVEAYLAELRIRLRGLAEADVSEVIAELRSHIDESSRGDAVDAVLMRLGSPAELASLYETENLFDRAARSQSSPWLLLRTITRWATFSIAGSFVLFMLIAGYVVAASFFLAALVKPFSPDRVGLWRLANGDFSLRLGFVEGPPPQATELLGWGLIPAGFLIGAVAFWLIPRFGRWAIRHWRRVPDLPSRAERR